LQFAAPTPHQSGNAGPDAAILISDEDPEFPFLAHTCGRSGGGCDLLLEHRQIGRIRRVLDYQLVGPAAR
jgi:hypothetical protein